MSVPKVHPYHCIPQERALKLLLVLAGHEADGLAPSQIAKALRISPSVATRDLWNLMNAAFAVELPSGNYALGPKPVQIALAYQRGLSDLRRKAEEIEARYSKEPK